MKLKDVLTTIFGYTPKEVYLFSLPEREENSEEENISNGKNTENVNQKQEEQKNIFTSLSVNLDYIKIKYNTLINSDILVREFILNARGKQYKAFLLYIDGMVDSKIMDDFILKPLILRNRSNLFDNSQNRVVSEAVTNNITIRKVKKFDLSSYLISCLLPQNSVQEITNFDEVTSGVNSRQLCSFY